MFLKFADWFVYGIIGMSAETSGSDRTLLLYSLRCVI